MLWGDQWICICSCHNFVLRTKCRECGRDKIEGNVSEEEWEEVMEEVIKVNKENKLRSN